MMWSNFNSHPSQKIIIKIKKERGQSFTSFCSCFPTFLLHFLESANIALRTETYFEHPEEIGRCRLGIVYICIGYRSNCSEEASTSRGVENGVCECVVDMGFSKYTTMKLSSDPQKPSADRLSFKHFVPAQISCQISLGLHSQRSWLQRTKNENTNKSGHFRTM